MKILEWNVQEPLTYVLTGKFEAPSKEWIHEDFPLIDYELFVITKGSLYLTYQKEQYTVNEGECLILPPSPPPDNRRKGFQRSDCSFYWLHFSCRDPLLSRELSSQQLKEYASQLSPDSLCIAQQFKIPAPEKVLVLMRQLQDAVKSEYGRTVLNYMSTTILCELHQQFSCQQAEIRPQYHLQKQMYYDIIDFVKMNTHTNLRVVDIAEHFGYNEKYLSNQFSNIAGMPLKKFILTNKMDMANFMLSDTNKPISDISLSLGFQDSHNFCKAYKKICGLTPSEYRNAFSKRLLFHQ